MVQSEPETTDSGIMLVFQASIIFGGSWSDPLHLAKPVLSNTLPLHQILPYTSIQSNYSTVYPDLGHLYSLLKR